MPLVLYDTYSKKEKEFVPLKKGEVTMYTCGPTVYGRPHIGNYSSFLMADLLRRWLEVSGYRVKHVKNITDVGHLVKDQDHGEDKIEKQAKEEKAERAGKAERSVTREDVMTIVEKYTNQYLEDEKALNMLEPFARPRATETIPEMIAIIEVLIKEGNAYETEDGVYFSVESFPAYGKLSGNTLENLNAGARISVDEKKKHPADFALWKKTVGENAHHVLRWNSAFGEGFPGWHIECSAMSRKFLGEQMDIHTGGEDNIFPHHECEVAQSECSMSRLVGSGSSLPVRSQEAKAGIRVVEKKQFVGLWLHKRRIDLGSEKMSKSLGNIIMIPDIIAMGYSPLDLRYYLLSVHYRTQLKFTKKGLDDAHKARRQIMEWISDVQKWQEGSIAESATQDFSVRDLRLWKDWKKEFREAMNSDLNTPKALAVVFGFMGASRSGIIRNLPFTQEQLDYLKECAHMLQETFGCFEPEIAGSIPSDVQELLDARSKARAEKDFAASDRLREEIRVKGYEVRDEAGEQIVKKR